MAKMAFQAARMGYRAAHVAGNLYNAAEAWEHGDVLGTMGGVLGAATNGFHLSAGGSFNPCAAGPWAKVAWQAVQAGQDVVQVGNIARSVMEGRYLSALSDGLMMAHSTYNMLRACFAGDTLLLTPEGLRRIDELRVGDLVFSRDENDPNGPVLAKRVEEVFVRTGRIWVLRVRGQEIRTTCEHPFYVVGKDWTDVLKLEPGDVLLSHDGQTSEVEAAWDTTEYGTVYNIQVGDFHTYFLGCQVWGNQSVWAHNSKYSSQKALQYAQEAAEKAKEDAQFARNRVQGNSFRDQLADAQGLSADHVVKELKIRPYLDNGELADYTIDVDVATLKGTATDVELRLNEAKSSDNAPFTKNQKPGYPLIERNGGVVENHAGGDLLPKGTPVPPTEVRGFRLGDTLFGTGRSLEEEGLG